MRALDLYAKIEPMIGFYDEYEELYDKYLDILEALDAKRILDIGCGNGKFLQKLKGADYSALGIDRSEEMVKIATSLGVDARVSELKDLQEKFDCTTAIGDVLNYMSKAELSDFFIDLKNRLRKNSYFIADINTLSGFIEVAEGLLLKETSNQFLAIEADFKDRVLSTKITLFENEKKYYKKFSDTILQYYHPAELFKNIDGFELIRSFDISMFGERDKTILLFKI
ncbi:MAG: methyltransferase domain-containing protein [Sulfurospirillum sp.]